MLHLTTTSVNPMKTSPSSATCPVDGTPFYRECAKCESCVLIEAWSKPYKPPSQGRLWIREVLACIIRALPSRSPNEDELHRPLDARASGP
jgi:hypothetical protein